MSTETAARGSRSIRRPAVTGFVVGFFMAFVATFLALAIGFFERIHALLVPASVILSPVSDAMSDWNGLVNMSVAGVVNGLVYAAVFTLVATVLTAVRQR